MVLLIGATMISALQDTGFTGRLLTASIVISCVSSLPLFPSLPSVNAISSVNSGLRRLLRSDYSGINKLNCSKSSSWFWNLCSWLVLLRWWELLVCHWHMMSCSILRTHFQSFPNYCSQLGRFGCIISVLGWIIVGWYMFVLGMDNTVGKCNLRICLFLCSRCWA